MRCVWGPLWRNGHIDRPGHRIAKLRRSRLQQFRISPGQIESVALCACGFLKIVLLNQGQFRVPDPWRIPAPRQARKMAGVALVGCLMFAFVAIKEGNFDWQRYTSIVGIFTLVCAGSWGLSALTGT